MNKIHNVIWSKAHQAWVVVAEGTKTCTKSGARALRSLAVLLFLTPAGVFAATLPSGGQVTLGQGSIVSSGADQLVIKQASEKLGINWQSFNIGADGRVVFDQPGTHSIVLNRVVGSDGSAILGKIDANGQVFLINPNGVIFGKEAQVNVGGIVASTLNITDKDFKEGKYRFDESGSSGDIVNLGALQAAEGGYVALIGKNVQNHGVIKAKLGTAALAAGGSVTLDFGGDGLLNIQVDQSTINALVENKGLIKADGGSVLLSARATNALTQSVVNNEGVIEAQTIQSKSGKIFLDGGNEGGLVKVAGTLNASAKASGDGGFIETSGAHVAVAKETVITAGAANGKAGKWLLDPTDFAVEAGNGGKSLSSIGNSTLNDILATTNVELQTSASGAGAGDLFVKAPVTWNADTTLTLTAHHDIVVGSNIDVRGENGGLALNFGNPVATQGFRLENGAKVNLEGASSTFSQNGKAFTVIRSYEDMAQISNTTAAQNFVLGADVVAGGSKTDNEGVGYLPSDYATAYSGTLDGLGHAITYLWVIQNAGSATYGGLFSHTDGATIRNLRMSTIMNGGTAGLIAGVANNTYIQNVSVDGSIYGKVVGGLVAVGDNVTIDNSSANISLRSTAGVGGGLAASLTNSNVFNSYATTHISGAGTLGGLVGKAIGSNFTNVRSFGDIETDSSSAFGGLIGSLSGSSIHNAYSTVSITNNLGSDVGGLVGVSSNSTLLNAYSAGAVSGVDRVGGLVGSDNGSTFTNVFSTSSVDGQSTVGGLIGKATGTTVQNAYASGPVSGNVAGGFAGQADSSAFQYTYSNGRVTGSSLGGYLAKGTGNNVVDSYWDLGSSGQASSIAGVGKTTEQMRSSSTFSGWSLSDLGGTADTWRIYEGATGPLMRFALTKAEVSGTARLTYNGTVLSEADLKSQSTYGHSTAIYDYGFWTNWSGGDQSATDAAFILGGATHDSGLTIRNAGIYAADRFHSSQYGYDIVQADNTVTVDKAVLSVAATGNNKIYDGLTSATTSFTDNRISGDDLAISGKAVFSDKNAGTGKSVSVTDISLGGSDAANYIWNTTTATTANIEKAALSVSAHAYDKTYDGTTSSTGFFYSDKVGADNISISSTSGLQFLDKNAGSEKLLKATGVTVTGADAGNYTWHSTVETTATISKANLEISATAPAKTYDGTTDATVSLSDNRIAGDDLSLSYGSALFDTKNAGTNKVVSVGGIAVSGADADNYSWSSWTTTFSDIKKAGLVVSAIAQDKTYDGSTRATSVFSDNRIGSDELVLTGESNFSDKNAGTGKLVTVSGITVAGADAGNYIWHDTTSSTASIAKASLAITAEASDRVYDGTSAASVILHDNRIAGDVLDIDSRAAFADKNAGTNKTVNVGSIAVSGADAQNYTWGGSTTATGAITKAHLDIIAHAENKVYDGSTAASVTLTDNRINGDKLFVSSTSADFDSKDAGSDKTVTARGLTVAGADAGNYEWETQKITTAEITKAFLRVTASGVNKAYDSNRLATVSLKGDQVAGDQIVLTAGSATFNDQNVGIAKSVSIKDISISGTDAGNYTFSDSASATADINKANLMVTGNKVIKNVGDQDPALSWSLVGGMLYGDDKLGGELHRAAGEKAGMYEIDRGTLVSPSNYSVVYKPGQLEITGIPEIETIEFDAAVASVTRAVKAIGTATKTTDVDTSGYRLLNLGMKLPDEVIASDR